MSTSERVRTCLATELFRGPKVLFCDGAVAAAGIPYREMLWGLFRALAREGNTVVLAERHDPRGFGQCLGRRVARGPFPVYRLPVSDSKGNLGLSETPSLWWIDWRLSRGTLARRRLGGFLFFCLFGFALLSLLLSGGANRFLADRYAITAVLQADVPSPKRKVGAKGRPPSPGTLRGVPGP